MFRLACILVPDNLCADIQREITPISVIHLLYTINMDS